MAEKRIIQLNLTPAEAGLMAMCCGVFLQPSVAALGVTGIAQVLAEYPEIGRGLYQKIRPWALSATEEEFAPEFDNA